ncbi:MAG: ABC transporter ATP-binding protein [Fibrobacteria bacterium]
MAVSSYLFGMALLEVRNLKTHFRSGARPRHPLPEGGQDPGLVRAVDGISFSVAAGEVLALVGESGSGKSVTSLSVLGLIPGAGFHAAGEILFESRASGPVDLAKLPEREWLALRGSEISLVFQDPMNALNPVIPCGDQVAEGLRLHRKLPRAEARAKALELFREVGIPDPDRRLDEYPHQMSGGMRQRVVIAIALACGPRLLIADEPTTALDVTVQAQILQLLLRERQARGMGILLITHDLGVVAETADRVAVMQAGRIVETASVKELFANPRHPYTRMLLESVPALRARANGNPAAESGEKRESSVVKSASGGISDPRVPLLSARELRTWFPIRTGFLQRTTGQVKALDGFSLDIARGETVGLVGESGCGKSTAGRTLLRLQAPTSGSIAWEGRDLLAMGAGDLRAFRRRAQIVFQDPYSSLNPRMIIGSILSEPLRIHGLHKGQESAQVAKMLAAVGLSPDHANRYPHEFSGGQRQRIAIARALMAEPEFVVADEPVSSLDVSIQAQVLDLLMDLKARLGLTYLFISHDLGVIRLISDRVAVMYLGRIVELADRETLFANPLHPYTQALFASIPGAARVEEGTRSGLQSGDRERKVLQGDVPNPAKPPEGCHFHSRCPVAMERCRKEYPPLEVPEGLRGNTGIGATAERRVACWLHPGRAGAVGGNFLSRAEKPSAK